MQGARSRGSRVLLGGAFAICAAPCIGPVLAAILVLAGTSDTVLQGAFLLALLLARARDPVRRRRRGLHEGDGSVSLAARPLRGDPVRQRRDHGRARAPALLRALLHPPRSTSTARSSASGSTGSSERQDRPPALLACRTWRRSCSWGSISSSAASWRGFFPTTSSSRRIRPIRPTSSSATSRASTRRRRRQLAGHRRSSATRTTPTRPGLRAANAAGFDQVIVKSALVERAPELVAELTGP